MTNYEQLLDNYEDALFRIFIDQIATEEGELFIKENERLKVDPDAAVPDALDYRCRRLIRHAFGKKRRHRAFRYFRKAVASVSIVFFIFSAFFSTAFALVPEVRIWTLNLLIGVSDVATSLTFASNYSDRASSTVSGNYFYGYVLPEIPKGFFVTDEGNDGRTIWIKYENDEDKSIALDISGSTTIVLNVDTEDADSITNIIIHGFEGFLIEKGNKIHIVWGDSEQGKYVNIVCMNIDKEVALAIAENMRP